ncbi:glycosyltransferase [Candidatus Gottesmanbacteria bacterium]|nr:glycosyltransferase [Candidatus Gottesmanbacteria bacterium]
MRPPRFSVIIPTLNEEKFLPNLLASLVGQTEKPFEVIVVDGKSKDKTVTVANSFTKKLPICVIECDRANISIQRNKGAAAARGEWLVFVDADSLLLPYFFERIEDFIQRAKPSFFTTWFRPDSEVVGDAIFTLLANLYVEGATIVKRPLSPGPMTILRRPAFASVHGYDETVAWGEDYDLTARLVARGVSFRILRETLYVHSLRRLRAEGKLKVLGLYSKAALLAVLTGRTFRRVSDYMMGGQLYNRAKR